MDLARNSSEMYPSMQGEKMNYPCICLPYKLCPDCEVGDEVTLILKGKVKNINLSEYSQDITFEISDGEVKELNDSKKEDKDETLLGKAK